MWHTGGAANSLPAMVDQSNGRQAKRADVKLLIGDASLKILPIRSEDR